MIDLQKIKSELEALGAEDVHIHKNRVSWESNDIDPRDFVDVSTNYLAKEVGLCIYSDGRVIVRSMEGRWLGVKDVVHATGVNDLLNLKPHEYGILKLKYGFNKLDLYVPQFLKDRLKGG